MQEKIIEICNLSKSFGKLKAVDNVSFDVYKGDVFGFLGPNGAGKSTTIRSMLSLITPTSGEIRLFGKNIRNHRTEILPRVGCIIEKPDFYPYLSALKNLQIMARISGCGVSSNRISEVIEFVGLKGREHDKLKHYSHGMKQRLGIAQAIMHNPDLIILDEPNTGLDPQGILEIRHLIMQLQQQGKTILLSSHILPEIELIANRMVIISKGRSVVQGQVSELLNQQELIVTFEVDQPEQAAEIVKTRFAIDGQILNQSINLSTDYGTISLINKQLIEAGITVSAIVPKRKLEDYFLRLINN